MPAGSVGRRTWRLERSHIWLQMLQAFCSPQHLQHSQHRLYLQHHRIIGQLVPG
jgi:hypothetical protein